MNDAIEAVNRIAAGFARDHAATGFARQRKRPEDVRLNHFGKFGVGSFGRRFFQMHAGVVDKNRNRPGEFFGPVNKGSRRFKFRHVALQAQTPLLRVWHMAFSNSSFRRPTRITFAPDATKHFAMPKPRPVPPPVMSAVWPVRSKAELIFDLFMRGNRPKVTVCFGVYT